MLSQKQLLIFLSLLSFLTLPPLFGQGDQLEVDAGFDAESLVRDVFASGTCETITNIQAIGDDRGLGFFSGGANIVGFDRGIIMSTGRVTSAPGPNATNDTGTELEGQTGDIDLGRIADGDVYDHVGLEFDFVPLDSFVTFRYVFASEEYCEFVGSDFNDVFGFFVSGPGLSGIFSEDAINAAIVPGTTDAVSINTINRSANPSFYLPNELNADQVLCGLDEVTNPLIDVLEYDGLTTVLTATLKLFPCESYHIRLVISDVADPVYDSAVLLEAGSFDLGGSVSLIPNGADTINNLIFEGCNSGGFRVVRGSDSDPATDQTIAYRFAATPSEAIEGVDFVNPGGTVTIPAGEMFADVDIETIADGVTEGPEDIWVVLDIPCACYTDSVMITIAEPAPLAVNLGTAYYCPDQTATLDPMVSGGSPPYTYSWSTGDVVANPVLTPPLPTSISVAVTDACGQTINRQINTFSSSPPNASLPTQNITACWGEQEALNIELTGTPPFIVTYQRGANAPETIEFAAAGLQSWTINLGGEYELLTVQDQACNGTVSGRVPANFYRPVINPDVTNPTCANSNDGRIEVQHLPSVAPYTYTWSGTITNGLVADNLAPGVYSLSITDALGCTDERTFELRTPSPILGVEINCNQVRRPPLVLSATGGIPPYAYSVDGQNFWPAAGFDQLIPGQYYNLIIRDQNGCEFVQNDFFYPAASPRNLRLPTFIGQDLGGEVQIRPNYLVPYDQIADLRWYPPEIFDCPTCREPIASAPFSQAISVVATDIYGCTDSLATWLGVDGRAPVFIPNAFSPNGDGTNDYVAVFANTDQVAQVLRFRVFTRWGSQVYDAVSYSPNSARRGWDGMIDGRKAPPGVYPWTVELLLTNGEVYGATGSVVLMR